MEKDDVNISLEDNILTIKGEKKKEEEKEEGGRYYRECAYGSFQRSIRPGTKVDTENVDAVYKNGILKMLIPKKEAEKVKSNDIKVK